jgi:branched-chain amino acid transport system substrate-binding protein
MSALAACGGSSDNGGSSGGEKVDEVLVGIPAALTGPGAAYAKPQADMAQMVADAINENGGIKELGGAKLKLIVEDTKSDPTEAARIIREMAAQGVSAFVGPTLSGEVLAAKPLLQSLKVPAFTGSGDSRVTEDNKDGWIFRTSSNTGTAAEKTVDYISSLIDDGTLSDVHKVGIVSISTPPGTSVTPVVEKGLTDLGLETTKIEYDPTQVKDFAPTVAKLASENVDLVVGFQLPNDATLFAQAVAGQSWRPSGGFIFTGSPQFLDSFRAAAGSSVTGWVTSAFCPSLDSDYFTPETQQLAKDFEQKFGITVTGASANVGAANMTVLAQALATAKSADPADIAAAARSMKFDGPKDALYPYYMAAGGVDFDDNQENTALIIPFIQVTPDGGVATVYPPEVADAKLQPLAGA